MIKRWIKTAIQMYGLIISMAASRIGAHTFCATWANSVLDIRLETSFRNPSVMGPIPVVMGMMGV